MTNSLEDIIQWPDGSMCFREDLNQMSFKSDDYIVIYFDSPEYEQALSEM